MVADWMAAGGEADQEMSVKELAHLHHLHSVEECRNGCMES